MGRLFDDLVQRSKSELSIKEKEEALAKRLASSRDADLERAYLAITNEISARLKRADIRDSYSEKRFVGKKTIQRKHIMAYYHFTIYLIDAAKSQICFNPNYKRALDVFPALFVDRAGKDFIWQKLKLFFKENQIHRVFDDQYFKENDPIRIADYWDGCIIAKSADLLECYLSMIVLL